MSGWTLNCRDSERIWERFDTASERMDSFGRSLMQMLRKRSFLSCGAARAGAMLLMLEALMTHDISRGRPFL